MTDHYREIGLGSKTAIQLTSELAHLILTKQVNPGFLWALTHPNGQFPRAGQWQAASRMSGRFMPRVYCGLPVWAAMLTGLYREFGTVPPTNLVWP